MTSEVSGQSDSNVGNDIYSKMTWPGLVVYLMDKYIAYVILLILLVSVPLVFLIVYYSAKTDAL